MEAPRAPRLVSLDTYRGLTMLLLATSGLGLGGLAAQHPGSTLWALLGWELNHVPWRGCGVWDLIQPAFMFMVGVAIPYSYASRKAKGDSDRTIVAHAARRALILVLLAVFLASARGPRIDWVFFNVLGQIGLGYVPVLLLRGRTLRVQLAALGAILIGYWLLFALWPITPGSQPFIGFAAHWNQSANPAHDFDLWFLNLFPRHSPFLGNQGGYQTLSFIPSMGNMLLGLVAGETLLGPRDDAWKLRRLVRASVICFAIAVACDPAILRVVPSLWVICPIVKRIWTPSWALFSSGWTFAILAALYWIVDLRGYKRWTFPFVVVGMNSIAIYMMDQLLRGWTRGMFGVVFGPAAISGTLGTVMSCAGAAFLMWLCCWWMYRRKLFLRI